MGVRGGGQNDNFFKNGPRFQIRHPKIDPGANFQPNRRNLVFDQNWGIFRQGGAKKWGVKKIKKLCRAYYYQELSCKVLRQSD